jgi:hypothetical protein
VNGRHDTSQLTGLVDIPAACEVSPPIDAAIEPVAAP